MREADVKLVSSDDGNVCFVLGSRLVPYLNAVESGSMAAISLRRFVIQAGTSFPCRFRMKAAKPSASSARPSESCAAQPITPLRNSSIEWR